MAEANDKPLLTLTIDGQEVRVRPGTTVLQAAEKLGVYVPRYCYHPGLSVAGSCRMCLVEIEKFPKLQISCYTLAQEGMEVHTRTEAVQRARRAMLEFLLTNHPLDCPVCDQSGECDLQNFYMEYGRYQSRFLENKVKRKKAFPIGPHVVLDQERCILCSRCIRFCEEVSRSHELGIFNRGNRSVVDLFPGMTLDNPYSGNVIDICPVGALTEREFRFKCRVWYLATQDSVCTGCSRGCNVSIHYNASRQYKAGGKRVQRLKPRYNPHVNQWWMCDEGRFGYSFIDENRIEFPHRREGERLLPCDWEDALQEAGRALRSALDRFGPAGVGVIASPQLSNEELYLIRQIFREQLRVTNLGSLNPWEKPGFQDDYLIRSDKNPNRRGAQELGLTGDVEKILQQGARGEIKVLYLFRHDFTGTPGEELLASTELVIYQGSNWNETARQAHLILPAATHAEKEGTFTNFQGRIQRFRPAFPPLEESLPDLEILSRLAAAMEVPVPLSAPEDLFLQWFGKSYQELGEYGQLLQTAQTSA